MKHFLLFLFFVPTCVGMYEYRSKLRNIYKFGDTYGSLPSKLALLSVLDPLNADHHEAINVLNAIAQFEREWQLKREIHFTEIQCLNESLGFIIGVNCVWIIAGLIKVLSFSGSVAALLYLFEMGITMRFLVKINKHSKARECYERRRDELLDDLDLVKVDFT
jgi:hypothetical protein